MSRGLPAASPGTLDEEAPVFRGPREAAVGPMGLETMNVPVSGRRQSSHETPLEPIVLLRSARHVERAIAALRTVAARRVVVVAHPEAAALLDKAGIPESDRVFYADRRRFSAGAFAVSRTARALRRMGYGAVAVLWSTPDGVGFENVNRTALVLSPLGFLAVAPDGTITHVGPVRVLAREVRRAAWSLLTLGVIAITVRLPLLARRLVGR